MDTDVVVIGAGLAGLRCARELVDAGLDVRVLEADDAVGGRIRTDEVDGFLVDRGFQLLNPAYPAVRRWVDVPALGLQPLPAGVAARTATGLARLGHPLAAPRLVGPSVAAAGRRPGELVPVARWLRPLLRRPRRLGGERLAVHLAHRPDVDLRTSFDAAGVHGLMRRVLDAFLAGVVLDDEGTTSTAYALLLAETFARGTPSLPLDGMRALPAQLARPLGDRVRLGTPVAAVEPRAVVTEAGERVAARAVVVATGGAAAARLTDLPAPALRGVVTYWFAADEAPTESALLHVDARERPTGPLVNTAVISHAAASYAPRGRHLVQASALIGPGRSPGEDDVRRHAGELYGADPSRWTTIARHDVPEALPAQPAPLRDRRPLVLDGGVVVCGDHRDTASIQGALVSGHRAARAVLDRLG